MTLHPTKDVMKSGKNYLGSRATYYRYHNGERLITPVQQHKNQGNKTFCLYQLALKIRLKVVNQNR